MANEEHLKILKQGVVAWNQWIEKNPEIKPDLREADLRDADLSEAALSGAKFTWADLSRANLRRADLRGADLSMAILNGAILNGADLSGADLSGVWLLQASLGNTNLNRAILNRADLRGANLDKTNLTKADFYKAAVGYTTFGNVDLSGVVNLKTNRHFGPSTIGIDTIYRSKGNIPHSFLAGAGVPDEFITYMKSLVDKAIEFYSCFISYSSQDQEFAERLYADLQSKSVRTWFAPEDMKIGEDIWDTIDEAIRLRDKLLLILSENSIESTWVEDEVKKAFAEERDQKKKILFPVRLDDSVMDSHKPWATKIRENRHIGDFRQWKNHDSYQGSFNRLLRDLKADEMQSNQ